MDIVDDDETIEVPSDLDAPAMARRFVDAHSDALPDELKADAALLVTELVTNAVRHGRPRITVRIRLHPPSFGVLVQDEGAALPPDVVHAPSPTAAGGRGLVLVDRMSADWGVIPAETTPGKTVWFELTASSYDASE